VEVIKKKSRGSQKKEVDRASIEKELPTFPQVKSCKVWRGNNTKNREEEKLTRKGNRTSR